MSRMHALIHAWHDMDVPDGLHVEPLDGELVTQANPGHLHDLTGPQPVPPMALAGCGGHGCNGPLVA